ncbi:MAG TPA: PKD domain-containing protein, partial [Thermoanaerobaculia bacterium]
MSAPDDTVAAVAGDGAGILVFDLSNKTQPRPVYQNADKSTQSVWTAKMGNTRYAFLASIGGVFVYNLEQALTYTGGCLQNATNPANCPGVLVKQIATPSSASYVTGDGKYLAASFGPAGGFQIYDASDPLNPQLKLTGLRDASSRPVNGIALWHQGSTYYLAARLGLTLTLRTEETAIYDVSCIATSSCSGLGAPIWHQALDTQSGGELISFSRSDTTPFLYIGGNASCLGGDGLSHEWLFDVSNPSSPFDVTRVSRQCPVGANCAPPVIPETALYNGVSTTIPVSYWSYYERASPTGFNQVTPLAGKFNGQYFYRAGRSIFDVHRWVHDTAPTADFAWSPAQVYPGTPVTFTDTSTGGPTSWAWTFQNGSPANATTASPQVTFASTGTKSVSLISQNSSGTSNPVTKSVVVLNPAPVVTGVTVSPQNPSVCQPVTFTATGVTGQPTLGYSWAVTPTPPAGSPASSTSTLVWADTSQVVPNTPYTAQVTVTNGVGVAALPAGVTFQALQPLAFTGAAGAPENDPFTAATIQFHARSQGASSWSWNFGDGQGFRPYTNDPVSGPNPTFTYAAAGTYTVSVKIKNCVPANGETTSAQLTVHVTQTTPLIASFQAGVFCNLGLCLGTTGQPVPFTDSSTGAEHWDYDWSHTSSSAQSCNFTDIDHTSPVTSHTFTTNGTYYPCLRVRRGASEQNVFVHAGISFSGGGGGSAAITIGGNSAGLINQAYTFTASATNCTPSSSGWAWSVGGGTGSSTSSSISVTWATTGTKTVSATNSACGTATGFHTAAITDPNGGGGTLQAKFTFAPSSPKPGDTVSFDGSTSTGSPTSYIWSFGDGAQASTATATHVYAAAGSYVVQLSVGAAGTTCPIAPCVVQSTA